MSLIEEEKEEKKDYFAIRSHFSPISSAFDLL
jgi:hypothetical protein